MHSEPQARQQPAPHWTAVCRTEQILPFTGVCALVGGRQIAVFRVGADDARYFAIDNYDPNAECAVLSRGLVGNLGDRLVVASPIYKQHFDLQSGACLEAPGNSVAAYPVRVEDGRVWVNA